MDKDTRTYLRKHFSRYGGVRADVQDFIRNHLQTISNAVQDGDIDEAGRSIEDLVHDLKKVGL